MGARLFNIEETFEVRMVEDHQDMKEYSGIYVVPLTYFLKKIAQGDSKGKMETNRGHLREHNNLFSDTIYDVPTTGNSSLKGFAFTLVLVEKTLFIDPK